MNSVAWNNKRYLKLKELTGGSYGYIFLAKDLNTYTNVIVKMFKGCAKYGDINKEKEFLIKHTLGDECNEKKAETPPNLVKYVDYFEEDTKVFLVTEYCSKGDLFEMINEEIFTEYIARRYIEQILNGVKYMHDRNMCHLDMKPENIFIDENDVCKIGDFGTVKMVSENIFRCAEYNGTKIYHTPEFLQKPRIAGKPTDMWCIGHILYNMIEGSYIYNENNLIRNIESKIMTAYPVFNRITSSSCIDFINKCLIKDYNARITVEEALCHPFITQH
jgi:serine/threonine protein kinase